jgi:hypothetical protein
MNLLSFHLAFVCLAYAMNVQQYSIDVKYHAPVYSVVCGPELTVPNSPRNSGFGLLRMVNHMVIPAGPPMQSRSRRIGRANPRV